MVKSMGAHIIEFLDMNLMNWSSLMTGGAKRGVPNPWLFEEPEETRGLGFDEIRQQQQQIIQASGPLKPYFEAQMDIQLKMARHWTRAVITSQTTLSEGRAPSVCQMGEFPLLLSGTEHRGISCSSYCLNSEAIWC
ncbi:hypothetical protein CB1_000300023 [Camelus ferus]|nr:hypothetical protein CB1_000300023 [Camelus ferus]